MKSDALSSARPTREGQAAPDRGLPPRRADPARTAGGRRSHAGAATIYGDLRERIVSVSLVPGASLSETRIAAAYGVSRTPVREAFKRLAEDGFLDVVPQVGTYVARIDLKVVRDNLFVRETLECRIAELAAAQVGADAIRQLHANLASQQLALDARDAAGFFHADEALHRLLASVAGQSGAWTVIHAAKSQLDRVRRLSLGDPDRAVTRLHEHWRIVDCIERRDATGAAQAMREHVRSVLDAITQIASRHAGFFTSPDTTTP